MPSDSNIQSLLFGSHHAIHIRASNRAMAPSSAIIITGSIGSLGSALARTLATSYPDRFHLLLTCRNTEDARAAALSEFLKSKSANHSFESLDLSDLDAVKAFAERITQQVAAGELPPLIGGGIVNSAAFMTFARDSRTKTGLDIMYTINVLAPVLLVRSLLPVLAGKEGVEGTTAVNVASAAHAVGRLDYFRQQEEQKRSGKSSHKG